MERRSMRRNKYYEFDGGQEEKKERKVGKLIKKVDKWKLAKKAISLAASGCASIVVGKYLEASLPEMETLFEKI